LKKYKPISPFVDYSDMSEDRDEMFISPRSYHSDFYPIRKAGIGQFHT